MENLTIIADLSLEGLVDGATGANREDYHVVHMNLARDVKVGSYTDLRTVLAGEECIECGSPIRIITAIEMGHIFKLGTKYSEALGATFQDENEEEKPNLLSVSAMSLKAQKGSIRLTRGLKTLCTEESVFHRAGRRPQRESKRGNLCRREQRE